VGVYHASGMGVLGSSGGDRTREFEDVVLVHLDALYRTALRLTHNRAEAEDVVQETCLRAFRGFHRFDPGTNARAWVFTILRHVFLNRLRRAGREASESEEPRLESVLESATLGPDLDNPEEHFLQTVLHGDIDRALRALPAPFREVVILTDLEGLSYKETSDVLDCPIGTVMSRLYRARQLLRQTLGRYARERGYIKESG
jgi:RNA polymerase sigma-70 factor (ECF subfamily)